MTWGFLLVRVASECRDTSVCYNEPIRRTARMDLGLLIPLGALGLALFIYESWSQPDLAIWIRLLSPTGLVVLGSSAGLASDAIAGLGAAVGIGLIVIGLLAFRWTRDGGGPRWYYERIKQ